MNVAARNKAHNLADVVAATIETLTSSKICHNLDLTMASFSVPTVTSHAGSWGPPPLEENGVPTGLPGNIEKFSTLPYSPFGRSDRLGRVADFTSSGAGDNYFGRRADKLNKGRREFRQRQEDEENAEDSFQLVDTTKAVTTTKRFVNPASKRRQQSMRLRQINSRRQQAAGGSAAGQLDKMTRSAPGRGPGGRGGGGRGGFGGRGGRGTWQNRPDRQPSVAVQSTWKSVEEIDLAKLSKNLTAPTSVPTPADILWCGFLDEYNENYDKITSRVAVPLKRMENKEFYPVTTTDDPVLEKLAIDGAGQVFVTDASKYTSRYHMLASFY